jgi:hypothetical protein
VSQRERPLYYGVGEYLYIMGGRILHMEPLRLNMKVKKYMVGEDVTVV